MANSTADIELNQNGVPPFTELPIKKGDPFLSAWGLYGDQDELGTLNRLTNSRVVEAAKTEIQVGDRVSLNWPLDAQPRHTFFQRAVFHKSLFPLPPDIANDDVWTFNPQVSSQWDGLRHYGYQKEELFYNGITMNDIHKCDSTGQGSTVNGIQAWARKGIVGRGVLVDYHSWRESQKSNQLEQYDAFEDAEISLAEIKSCLAAQNTELRFADILFIRTGFTAALTNKSDNEIWNYQTKSPHRFGGVGQSIETLQWIWENFSAVAGDQPSFESWPPKSKGWSFHEVLLAGWGCPIGELFDLEALSQACKAHNRWTFFVTSEPCNVPGGVSSPPNAIAIF